MKPLIKKFIRNLNKLSTFWCANDSNIVTDKYRIHEMIDIFKNINLEKNKIYKVLDFGCGNGSQAKFLLTKKLDVCSVDIYKSHRINDQEINFILYDGKKLPYSDKYFDFIFSSNVLEHISDINQIQQELRRILKDNGKCIHALPSTSWRFWTSITTFVKYWYFDPRPHGEIVNNSLGELFYFSQFYWTKQFKKNKFKIENVFLNNLFYTGNNIFGEKISIKNRKIISKFFGSSCNIFRLSKI